MALRKLLRSIPWIGAAVALLAVGSAIRRKGLLGGTLDTALNAVPYVGGLKNLAEVVRGRDFIRDRSPRPERALAGGQPPDPFQSELVRVLRPAQPSLDSRRDLSDRLSSPS